SQPGIDATVASLQSCALVNPRNTKTRYSNVGPTIVGQAVAAVSGQSFEEYQREHLLQPLGMLDSAWRMNDDVRSRLATSYMRVADGAGGFVHREAPKFELGTIPAGNLYSTAGDMAKFARMLLAGGKIQDGRIVSASALREMTTPQLIEEESGFGLGFYVSRFAGHRTIQHSGAVYGFTSSLVVLPEARIAAIVLVNEDIAMGPVKRLSDAALSLMLEAKTGQARDEQPEPLPLDVEQLSALTGDYESGGYWAEIRLVDGLLEANISGQPMTLTPIGPFKFEADGQFTYRSAFEFQPSDDGGTSGFTALGQSFVRVDRDRVREIPSGYRKFLGSYGPDFIPLVVSARHGHLYAMTENMIDYRLTPLNQVVFRMPEGLYADEYLVFQVGEDGQVRSVNLANMTLPRRP
ncbi:MAG: beta-lactamase family protein, partial [Planctomycetes bacterium]|nr:beta-lactamase family protein [Planctomycetota bacterium]